MSKETVKPQKVPMRIGYACMVLGVPGTTLHTCTLKHANEKKLEEIIAGNLSAVDHMLEYNRRHHIRLFRLSSDLIPLATHPDISYPWQTRFRDELAALGEKARRYQIRLSMHPGQYTVLNSPDRGVVERAVEDLQYHCDFLDRMGMDTTCKVVLHVGGAYGDKPAALHRFAKNYSELDDSIRRRVVLENDDRIFTAEEVLNLGKMLGVPVIFDNLHNQVNPSEKQQDEQSWIQACAGTWEPKDGLPKIHYSQQAEGKKAGSHSGTIHADVFVAFVRKLKTRADIMIEVKDKNLSAVKGILCTDANTGIHDLEREWARYKYAVLEHSQRVYQDVRSLLKNKKQCPAVEFYRLIEEAWMTEPLQGSRINAALHVWGYFKKMATQAEKSRFERLLNKYQQENGSFTAMKRHLFRLAVKYEQQYLLESYYFIQE